MFWIINAILMLIALAFVLPSQLRKQKLLKDGRREQNIFIANEQLEELEQRFEQGEIKEEDYKSARDELEQSLYADVTDDNDLTMNNDSKPSFLSAVFIALLVPAIAIFVYLKVGNLTFTEKLDSKQAASDVINNKVPRNADGTPDIDTMVAGLQKKLEAEPNNAKGWYMLGRSYMVLKRFPDASKSFERSLKLKPDSADIMLSLADSLAMVNDGQIAGRPVSLINKALELEPNNMTALWLGGMASRQTGDNLIAVQRWRKVKEMLTDPKEKAEVASLITEAISGLSPAQKKSLGDDIESGVKANISNVSAKKVEGKPSAGITVSISLSEKFKAQVKPTDTVFVYAKAMSGPPMPLAAAKIQVKDLPTEILLNDEMAMMPSMKLSAFSEVIVGARVSKSGGPISQNGDLYSEKKSIKAGDKIQLSIDTVLVK